MNSVSHKEPWYSRHALLVLGIFVFVLYLKTIGLGYSKLDDDFYILINQLSNSKWSSVIDVFNEGVGGKRDILYRPLFRVTFIIENHILSLFDPADFSQSAIKLAHFDNILLHIVQVLLLFKLLLSLSFSRVNAFFAALIFAAHPIMTMAVAWVPGRNEMMLSIFILAFFIYFLNYIETNSYKSLVLQFVFLLCAVFTKETAVFIPFLVVLYLILMKKYSLVHSLKSYSFLLSVLVLGIWYYQRNNALEKGYIYDGIYSSFVLFIERIPGILQYTGKVFLPLNLSVYPYIKDTSYLPGILSVIILIVLIFVNKNRNTSMLLFGLAWYILFILPAFLVPKNLTNAFFEHRMYVPFTGMILVIASAFQNSSFKLKYTRTWLVPLVLFIFSSMTFNYISLFKDEFTFFENAVKENPHSAQAMRMYGMQLNSAGKPDKAILYFEKALQLDSNEIMANYYVADLLYMNEYSFDKAIYHLDREIKINPFYLETYGKRVYIAHQQKDYQTIKKLMLQVLEMYPKNQISSLNLLISYIELGEKANAAAHLKRMKSEGIDVDASLISRVENM